LPFERSTFDIASIAGLGRASGLLSLLSGALNFCARF
jgi:hypothetical protein